MHKFFGDVLPDHGHYRLVDLGGKYPETHWAPSLDEFCTLAESYEGRQRIYFGTASYREPTRGEAANVLLNKALRLDIDAGEEKFRKHKGVGVYETQQDALRAVVAFTRDTGLKPSYVVSSGAGLHVYYVLEAALEPAEWGRWATRLYALCQSSGILVDHTTTTDVTRLLRVPGGLHETGPEVRVLAGAGAPVSFDTLESILPVQRTYGAEDMALTAEFIDDMRAERNYPPASAFKIANRCGALRAVVDAGGDATEPLWRAMIGLVKHTVEGEDQCHEWSAGYDGYDYGETQKKIDLWKAGPTTCKQFSRHSDACATCPHFGKIKSPIQLGQLNDAEQAELPPEQQTTIAEPPEPESEGAPWDGMLPRGARIVRDAAGDPHLQYLIKQTRKDEDGHAVTTDVWVPLANVVFWFGQWGEAATSADNAQVTLYVWTGRNVARYDLEQIVMHSPGELLKALASKAVHTTIHPLAAKATHTYAKVQYMHIQKLHRSLRITDRFGMRQLDSGELVAVHGRYTIHGDGIITDTFIGPALKDITNHYPIPLPPATPGRERWGPEVWDSHIIPAARKHVEFLNKHYGRPEMVRYQLTIMMAIASATMPFVLGTYTGGDLPAQSSLTVSLYSKDGGFGKTTAAHAGVLAYGDPNKIGRAQGDQSATALFRLARLSLGGSMPSVMDEMGTLSSKSAMELLSSVANGAARGTLTRNGGIVCRSPWALINVITTNRSMQEILQQGDTGEGTAVPNRVLEIDVGDMPKPDLDQRAAFHEEWGKVVQDCQGALGAVLQRELARMGTEGAHTLLRQWVKTCEEKVKGEANDRFYIRALAGVAAAYAILTPLGLAPFDLKALFREFIRVHKETVDLINNTTSTTSPLDHLNRALNDFMPNTVITKKEVHRAGQGLDVVLNERMPDRIVARHIRDHNRTYVIADSLRKWCEERKLSEWEIVTAAQRMGVLIPPKKGAQKGRIGRHNITRGLRVETNQTVYVYTFDTRKLQSLLDDKAGIPLNLRDDATPDQPAEVLDLTAARAARDVAKEVLVAPQDAPKAGGVET